MGESVIRFIIGGFLVSAFALLGDVLKPKSFAGLFAAAPSIALATLILTIHGRGVGYAAAEARSMIFGAIAFFLYACSVCFVTMRYKLTATIAASSLIVLWISCALGLELLIGR